MDNLILRTADSLKKNNMRTFVVSDRTQVLPIVRELIAGGTSAASGGSVTLDECGINDYLRDSSLKFFERTPDMPPDKLAEFFAVEKTVDFYFSSSNAITQAGELYNVDGRANRVSCLAHGPKNVIIVAGCNKIVPDLHAAALRVKTIAAPKNCVRLGYKTYCFYKGHCTSLDKSDAMTSGCGTAERICCNYLVSGYQRIDGRITVILVGEALGY